MPFSKQEAFDKVANHLLTQMKQSIQNGITSNGPECAYRGENGLMCAVGCLIPDELYKEEMEGYQASHVISAYPELQNFIGDKGVFALVQDLQTVHDENVPDNWRDNLECLGENYGLSIAVLEKY